MRNQTLEEAIQCFRLFKKHVIVDFIKDIKRDRSIRKSDKKYERYEKKCVKLGITNIIDYDALPEPPIIPFLVDKEKLPLEKFNNLLASGIVGVIGWDSFHYELCCLTSNFRLIKSYFSKFGYSPECFQDKIDCYDFMFDLLLEAIQGGNMEPNYYSEISYIEMKSDALIHKVLRYILANLDQYKNHFINARDTEKAEIYWVEALYNEAKQDMFEKKIHPSA